MKSKGPRPRLKSAHATLNRKSIHRPVDETICAFQHWRERRFFLALRPRFDRFDLFERLADQPGADVCSRLINSGAVSFSAISVDCCRRIGPASSCTAIFIVVTPVCFSPLTIAQFTGAAPRYLGSREK